MSIFVTHGPKLIILGPAQHPKSCHFDNCGAKMGGPRRNELILTRRRDVFDEKTADKAKPAMKVYLHLDFIPSDMSAQFQRLWRYDQSEESMIMATHT